jgi:hypothetical protein
MSIRSITDRIATSQQKKLRHDMYYRSWRTVMVVDFNRLYGVNFIPPVDYSKLKFIRDLTEPFQINKQLLQIQSHYKKALKEAGLDISIKELVWRYMHLNLSHYKFTEGSDQSVKRDAIVLPIEEYIQLVKHDVPLKTAIELYKHGLTTQQVIENKDIPIEWTVTTFSNRNLEG